MEARFLTNGDAAISIQVGDRISLEVSKRVRSLLRALEAEPIEGVEELLPTYCSLMIHYEPGTIRYDALVEQCRRRVEALPDTAEEGAEEEMVCEIPVLYGGVCGEDLQEVAGYHQMSVQQVIDAHTAKDNYTYMLGAAPGMAYLGAENGLHMPRRQTSRTQVEQGAVIIWENQTIIMPITYPTGWQVIGKTPVEVFDMGKPDPFLMKAGQWVRFRSIDRAEYEDIAAKVRAGAYQCRFYRKEAAK